MKDKHLFDSLEAALQHKQSVAANRGAYYYTVQVPYEVRCSDWCARKLGHTKTAWRDETRFDDRRFGQDLAVADQRIRECKAAIDTKMDEYQRQLALSVASRSAEAEKLEQQKSAIHYYQQQNRAIESALNALQVKVAQEQFKVQHLAAAVGQGRLQLQCLAAESATVQTTKAALPSKIQETKDKVAGQEAKAACMEEETKSLGEQVPTEQRSLFDAINGMSPVKRTVLFASMYGTSGKEIILGMIEAIGFDANHLAYLSIEKNCGDLLEVALSHGANCASCVRQEDGRSLLQKAITEHKEDLVARILAKEQELDVTLVNAIKQTDIATLDKLLHIDPGSIHKAIHGYTLLQCAISHNNAVVTDHIVQLDSSTVHALNSQGESCFKIAIRTALTSGSEETTKLITRYVDLEKELVQLVDSKDSELFETALRICSVPHEVLVKLTAHAIKTDATEIAASIIAHNHEIDLSSIYSEALSSHDQHVLLNLTMVAPKFSDLLAQNPDALVEFQAYLAGASGIGATDLVGDHGVV